MTLRISEIYGPTIQGEGALIGAPTVFVRAGGCDYRCAWCDTLYAVDAKHRHDWAFMPVADVWQKVLTLSGGKPITVSITGGNPAIQDFGPLIRLGKPKGYRFSCETQGSVTKPWFAELDTLVLSPKPPSSGQVVKWPAFHACIASAKGRPQVVLKVVIFDEADYAFAKEIAAKFPNLPIYLQPGNPEVEPDTPVDLEAATARLRWLVEKTTSDQWFTPRILPQLHMLIWGNKRGV